MRMLKRTYLAVLTALLAAAFMLSADGFVLPSGLLGVEPAEAQQIQRVRKKRRRSLLQLLFSPRPKKVKRRAIKRQRISKKFRKKKRRTKGRRTRQAVAAAAVISRVEKNEDARIVLVVGDFFASGLAKGLVRSFAQSPDIRIVAKTSGSSGFIRDDYYDWVGEVGPMIDETRPVAVVAMVGTNDRQYLRKDGVKIEKRTEEWDTNYKQRIENFANAVRSKQVPFIWVGLPPVRIRSMTRDFLFFNEVYREKTEKVGGQFIDVWDGFTDEEGNFVTSGPNVNGQIVRLRSKDGINVTKQGQDKLAFYAEKGVRKIIGGDLSALAGLTNQPASVVTPTYDPAKTGRTEIIRLNDPALDGANALTGTGPVVVEGATYKVDALLAGGNKDKNRQRKSIAGRADDTAWPPRSPTPKQTPDPVASTIHP